jgi:hypothetical protein
MDSKMHTHVSIGSKRYNFKIMLNGPALRTHMHVVQASKFVRRM